MTEGVRKSMEEFIPAEIKVVEFSSEDVITTSNGSFELPDDNLGG